MRFTIKARSSDCAARTGEIEVRGRKFSTPVFMPVGTQGAVKCAIPRDLAEIGAEVVLGNTYHLHIRPGDEIVKKLGGIHAFMGWDGAILTDSGGFQVFSLATLNRIVDEGVHFRNHVDGSALFLGPRESIAIQETLDSDIMMAFDDCPPYPVSKTDAAASLKRTLKWEAASLDARTGDAALFGIQQGAFFEDLREECAARLSEMPFDGYAIGGVSVGEPKGLGMEIVEHSAPLLPGEKPRYLMGMGFPDDIVRAVAAGIDMFDCVIPTRNARGGGFFTSGPEGFRGHITNAQYAEDDSPIDDQCDCYCCKNFSKGYIRHLFMAEEVTGLVLLTLHNLRYYMRLMENIRKAISEGRFSEFARGFCG